MPVHRGKALWGHNEKVVWPETSPFGTLNLDFHSPELWESKFLLFKPPSLWYSIRVAWADKYNGIWFSDWVPGLLILVPPYFIIRKQLPLHSLFLLFLFLFILFYCCKLREYLKVVDLCCCKELEKNLFFAIEPERTYAMKGMLSFGYLCLYTVCDISKSLPHCWSCLEEQY